MATRMLIDARHPEETRVAVLKGNRIEEFDFESADHKQIKGNIYLAKVTRVEPSLQAAFVDFGGNRHGFLAFSEIHPDYYQIPKEDREQLLAEEAEAAEEEARLRNEDEEDGNAPGDEYDADDESAEALAEDLAEDGMEEIDTSEKDKVATIEEGQVDGDDEDDDDYDDDSGDDESDDENGESDSEGEDGNQRGRGRGRGRGGKGRRQGRGNSRGKKNGGKQSRAKQVDEVRAKRMALRRRYKIQDVINRRQVLLVQVVKEERGNKGAALTSYLSLAGRYTVLMPNSSSGGGISRKIANSGDRKRLKQVVSDLVLPKSMGLIVRTAGLSRTKTEIKRDFDYLARVWDEIREKTLSSAAPAQIHSDSDLIKRAIRDIYNRDIEEVIVEGEDGYKSAKAFMKMLMPSHARRVKSYSDPVPLFQRYGAEDQLREMYDPVVQLKSGGYLVINPTEALVSIDINSGRSTKEHGIEATATATNLEAAREIARQLRLRDMAGLVVIDFIDMDYNSNVRKVERTMKDALKHDRARIQVGRISSFGLMEMSRQRLRTGVLEASTRECPHCDGTGLVRTASSAGLSALRLIEDEAAKGKGSIITLSASTEAAVYLLNSKRGDLLEIGDRYHVKVEVVPEGEDEGAKMTVASSGPRPKARPDFQPIIDDDDDDDIEEIDDSEDEEEDDRDNNRRGGRGRGGRSRGGRNRGGRGRDGADRNNGDSNDGDRNDGDRNDGDQNDGGQNENRGGSNDNSSETSGDDVDEDGRPKRRRRRRGGRGRNRGDSQNDGQNTGQSGGQNDDRNDGSDENPSKGNEGGEQRSQNHSDEEGEDRPKKRRRRGGRGRRGKGGADRQDENGGNKDPSADDIQEGAKALEGVSDQVKEDMAVVAGPDGAAETAPNTAAEEKPKRSRRKKAAPKAETGEEAEATAEEAPKEKPKRAPRKKAAPKAKPAAADSEEAAEEKPKRAPRKRAPAKKKVAEESSEAVEPEAKPAAKAKATKAPATKAKTAAKPKASKSAPAAEEAAAPATGKARKGWWQRTFGE